MGVSMRAGMRRRAGPGGWRMGVTAVMVPVMGAHVWPAARLMDGLSAKTDGRESARRVCVATRREYPLSPVTGAQ
jgi:hypothetical protein